MVILYSVLFIVCPLEYGLIVSGFFRVVNPRLINLGLVELDRSREDRDSREPNRDINERKEDKEKGDEGDCFFHDVILCVCCLVSLWLI